jgi:hypothetical protein
MRKKSSTEKTRRWRESNPIRAAFLNLKNNAKRRGKEFLLSFEEFCEFASKNKIVYGKKRNKDTWSIDRIDSSKGYSIDNIQLLTLAENSKKQHFEYEFRVFEFTEDYQNARIKRNRKHEYSDSPF